MKKSIIFLFLLVALLSAGCSQAMNRCIPSKVAAVPTDMNKIHQNQETTDVGNWQENIPSTWSVQPNWWKPFRAELDNTGLTSAAAKDGVVWVTAIFQVLRYDSKTGTAKLYQLLDNQQEPVAFRDILFTHDGNLWALVNINKPGYSIGIARYNPESDRFEFVPALTQAVDNEDVFFTDSQVLVETPDGKILAPMRKNIVAYDPQQKTVRRLLPQDFSLSVSALAVAENIVWFTVIQDMDLRSLDLQTGKLMNYGYTPNVLDKARWHDEISDTSQPLAIDKQGTVWMGYLGRLKQKEGQYHWEQVSYPPELVLETVVDPYADKFEYRYRWSSILSMHNYSDGNIWFNTGAGLVQYDITKGIWCNSIKTALPVIADDGQGALWLAVTNHDGYVYIYKIELQP